MLPKNRFGECSVDKISSDNRSVADLKDKENVLNFLNSNKVTRKDQLPNISSIKRSSSLNGKQ
jgi:hypothetical protein